MKSSSKHLKQHKELNMIRKARYRLLKHAGVTKILRAEMYYPVVIVVHPEVHDISTVIITMMWCTTLLNNSRSRMKIFSRGEIRLPHFTSQRLLTVSFESYFECAVLTEQSEAEFMQSFFQLQSRSLARFETFS